MNRNLQKFEYESIFFSSVTFSSFFFFFKHNKLNKKTKKRRASLCLPSTNQRAAPQLVVIFTASLNGFHLCNLSTSDCLGDLSEWQVVLKLESISGLGLKGVIVTLLDLYKVQWFLTRQLHNPVGEGKRLRGRWCNLKKYYGAKGQNVICSSLVLTNSSVFGCIYLFVCLFFWIHPNYISFRCCWRFSVVQVIIVLEGSWTGFVI